MVEITVNRLHEIVEEIHDIMDDHTIPQLDTSVDTGVKTRLYFKYDDLMRLESTQAIALSAIPEVARWNVNVKWKELNVWLKR